MKILLVLEATLGGTGRHILDLADGLLSLDHEVHLIYSRHRADNAFSKGLEILCSTSRPFFAQQIAMRREVGPADFRSYFALARYASQHGPFDIIHAHSTKAGFLARLLWKRRGAAFVYTPHGLMTQNPLLQGFRKNAVCALETVLARRSDAVIAVSQIEKQCAVHTGIPSRKLTVINNGMNQIQTTSQKLRQQVRARIGITPETVCIGSIGLLVANKEQGRLIDAFAVAKERTSRSVSLLLIGWGSMELELRRKVSRLGLQDSIHFLGQVSGADYFPAFDIFAHASRYEGFAYTFLEALNSGVPIVTTRVGGAEETVEPDINGFICDPWNTEEFASFLLELVEDRHRRDAMGKSARARAERFSSSTMVNATVELYNRLHKPGHSGSHVINERLISGNPQ